MRLSKKFRLQKEVHHLSCFAKLCMNNEPCNYTCMGGTAVSSLVCNSSKCIIIVGTNM